MPLTNPRDYDGQNLIWFSQSCLVTTLPAAATAQYQTVGLSILVPFVHRLRIARSHANNTVKTGSIVVSLVKFVHDQAAASPTVASDLITVAVASAATDINIITLTTTPADDEAEQVADTVYSIQVTGTNSADRWDDPSLVIGVEAIFSQAR